MSQDIKYIRQQLKSCEEVESPYDIKIGKHVKYITLEDIRMLVTENKEFVVLDAKTKEDLTKNTLLQIIVEKEQGSSPFFSIEVLTQIIRSYENED